MDDESCPAMLPPREPYVVLSQDEKDTRASIEFPPNDEECRAFSVDKFTTSYSHLLPTRVRVEQGYFDFERNFGVTTGEVYNMHFIKKVRSVSLLDSHSQRHILPLNASVEYSILHDPDGDQERARAGYLYRRAGDIMALKMLPTVVRAKNAYQGGDPTSSVDAYEMLIVLQVTKKHKFMRNRVLSVYSVTHSRKKTLSEECEGNFSTDPYGTKLFLPEILSHLANPFPATALMFISPDVTHSIPLHLFDEPLVLEGLVESRSVIATACDLQKPSSPSSASLQVGNLIEFPVSLPFTVTLLDWEREEEGGSDDSSSTSLVSRTRHIIDGFDPSKVSTCAISVEARRGHELLGLEVEVPHYQPLSIGGSRREGGEEEEGCGTYAMITKEADSPVRAAREDGNTGERGGRVETVIAGDDFVVRCKEVVDQSSGGAGSGETGGGGTGSGGAASAVTGPMNSERISMLEQQMEVGVCGVVWWSVENCDEGRLGFCITLVYSPNATPHF